MASQQNPKLSAIPFDGKRVIEIGSGAGAFTLEYLTHAREIVCVEKKVESHRLLEAEWQANRYSAHLIHRRSGIEALDIEDLGQFGFAVFANSF